MRAVLLILIIASFSMIADIRLPDDNKRTATITKCEWAKTYDNDNKKVDDVVLLRNDLSGYNKGKSCSNVNLCTGIATCTTTRDGRLVDQSTKSITCKSTRNLCNANTCAINKISKSIPKDIDDLEIGVPGGGAR